MFWDKIAHLYDLFENVYNGKVYTGTGKKVAKFIEPTDTGVGMRMWNRGDKHIYCAEMQETDSN